MIHFTHNDMDALGCMLCVNSKYKEKIARVYHTFYGDFEKQVDAIINDPDDIVIITDLSFSERPDCLKSLVSKKKFVQLVDHHSYPKEFWNEFDKLPNFKRIIDDSVCATLLCYDAFTKHLNEDERKSLKALCNIIDVYDCWRETHSSFDGSQLVNLWFWTKNLDELCTEIENNKYKLPPYAKDEIGSLRAEQEKAVKKAYENNQVHKCGPVTFVFNNDVFNPILIKEMREGQGFVVGSFQFNNGTFCFKCRVKQGTLSPYCLDRLRLELTGKTTGHPNAFSYVRDFNNSVEITNEYKRIVEVYSKIYYEDGIPTIPV